MMSGEPPYHLHFLVAGSYNACITLGNLDVDPLWWHEREVQLPETSYVAWYTLLLYRHR